MKQNKIIKKKNNREKTQHQQWRNKLTVGVSSLGKLCKNFSLCFAAAAKMELIRGKMIFVKYICMYMFKPPPRRPVKTSQSPAHKGSAKFN